MTIFHKNLLSVSRNITHKNTHTYTQTWKTNPYTQTEVYTHRNTHTHRDRNTPIIWISGKFKILIPTYFPSIISQNEFLCIFLISMVSFCLDIHLSTKYYHGMTLFIYLVRPDSSAALEPVLETVLLDQAGLELTYICVPLSPECWD